VTVVALDHRLLGLARGWDRGAGPRALLACAPSEQHDLGLIALGVALRARGWRITYLGQDTPLETLAESARSLGLLAGNIPRRRPGGGSGPRSRHKTMRPA
jgi:hypothetical protein